MDRRLYLPPIGRIPAAVSRARSQSGEGQAVVVPMFEAMVEWMGHPLYYTHFGGKAPKRSGPDHATIVLPGWHRVVMNTEQEVRQAILDFQAGRF